MKALFLGLVVSIMAVGFLAGCTTRSSQHWVETAIDEHGMKTQIVKRIVYPGDSSWDKPAVKDTIYQTCPISALDKAFNKLDTDQCVSEHTHNNGMTYTTRTHDSNGPVLSQAVPAAIIAGGIVGGAAVLRPARTNVNQTGGGASANADASAYAHQSQKQSADIDIRSGGHK